MRFRVVGMRQPPMRAVYLNHRLPPLLADFAVIRRRTHPTMESSGIRPITHAGGDLEYVDFGRASGSDFGCSAKMSQKGPAAFAVLYLPEPAVDFCAKLGLASLHNSFNGLAFFTARVRRFSGIRRIPVAPRAWGPNSTRAHGRYARSTSASARPVPIPDCCRSERCGGFDGLSWEQCGATGQIFAIGTQESELWLRFGD